MHAAEQNEWKAVEAVLARVRASLEQYRKDHPGPRNITQFWERLAGHTSISGAQLHSGTYLIRNRCPFTLDEARTIDAGLTKMQAEDNPCS